jgi:hypothetical protein
MKVVNNITRTILALLFVFSTPAWADIVFDDAFNFRDFRVNTPLTYTQGSDLLVIGIVITDSDTGNVPAGAIVRARNQVSNEEVVLRKDGTEYFQLLPYTAERAEGDWIVEVDSDVGDASALIPAFGIGPGSGQMPTVENLVATTGAQPSFTWTLPSDLLTQNDGNVDRLRARIIDSYDDWVLDDRFDNTATATSYTTAPDVITHNGAFIAQMMIEGLDPFNRSSNYATFVVDSVGVGGQPVTLESPYHARDFRGANSVGWGTGDRQDVCIDAFPDQDTYVHAEQSGVPILVYQQKDRPEEFCTGMNFDPARTGAWDIIAWNGAVKSTAQTYPLGPSQQLPLVANIRIVPNNLIPTIRWDLPVGNTVPFDEVQIGLFDDVTDFRLFRFGPGQDQLFDNLSATETSYQFAPGVLEEGGRYVARVVMRDRDDSGNTVNRSITFFNFTPIMGSGGGEIFLPTLDEGGIYNFDFDVTQAVPVTIDPEVAVGYIYEIGDGDPRFAMVNLPVEGDGLYDLTVYNDAGNVIQTTALAASTWFDFTTIDSSGISKFEVSGIEVSAGLDPLDTTAFMTTLTFASSGRFTGTMTPVTQEIEEPGVLMCDANLDDTIDIRDIRAIAMMRNQPATGPDDPMDWDQNGIISVLDARGCVLACNLPRCAIQ